MRTFHLLSKPYVFAVIVLVFVVSVMDYTYVVASVRLSSFSAQMSANQVQLAWQTASELNNVGFNLLRSTTPGGPYTQINSSMVKSQCFGCITGFSYSYQDTAVSPNQIYYYKLQTIETTGGKEEFGPVSTAPVTSSSSTSASSKASSASSTASSRASSSVSSSIASSTASVASSAVSSSSSIPSSSVPSAPPKIVLSSASSIASSTSTASSSRATSSQASSVATSSATSSPKIAYAPSSTSSSVATSRSVVSSSVSSSVTSVPPVAVASQASSSIDSTPPEVVEDEPGSTSTASPLRLLGATMFVVAGGLSLGAIGVGLLALFFFVRAILR